jgi:hypothetical protein
VGLLKSIGHIEIPPAVISHQVVLAASAYDHFVAVKAHSFPLHCVYATVLERRLIMGYRRSKKPNQYRFLRWLYPSAVAVVMMYFLDAMSELPCQLRLLAPNPATCRVEMPSFLFWGLAAVFVFGVVAAGYRYYRDFYLGEYWLDLDR